MKKQPVTYLGLPMPYVLPTGFSLIEEITVNGSTTLRPARVFVDDSYRVTQVAMPSGHVMWVAAQAGG